MKTTYHQRSDGDTDIVTHMTDREAALSGLRRTGDVHVLEDGTKVPIYEDIPGWKAQPARPTGGVEMTATATEVPVNGSSTKQAMREVLDEREAARTLGDRMRSLPGKTREYASRLFDYLHLSKAKGFFASAWDRVGPILSKILGPIKAIGWFNIIGALLTCQKGREIIRKVSSVTARVVSWPFRMIGRGLAWLGRKVGLGGIVDDVEFQFLRAGIWVRNHFNDAMDWLDRHEHHGAMRWGRSVYQLNVGRKLVTRYLPDNLRTPAHIGLLFVPNLGVGETNDAESKLSVVKDTLPSGESKDTDGAAVKAKGEKAKAEKKVKDAVPVEIVETKHEVIERIYGTLLSTGKKVKIRKVTKVDGSVLYTMNGATYTETELEPLVEFISENTPPPPMNRAARRATEQGKVPDPGAEPATA